jgi:hypothetical protein
MGLLVSSESTLMYAIFDQGELLDEYEVGSHTVPAHIDAFLYVCPQSVKRKEVEMLFLSHKEGTITAPSFVYALAHFLDIPRAQIGMGFNHLKGAESSFIRKP